MAVPKKVLSFLIGERDSLEYVTAVEKAMLLS